jgi:hypothetical protein
MVEFSFDRDEFRPDPSDRRREAERREERERFMDEQRQFESFLDEQRREMERDAQEEALRRVVNDPNIVIDPTLLEVINDPEMTMDKSMTVRRTSRRPMTGKQRIRRSGQFANLALGVDLPPARRKRKKTKTDKNMSKALREANARLRTKKGMLRKGKTQADVMRLAHRLRKKMS